MAARLLATLVLSAAAATACGGPRYVIAEPQAPPGNAIPGASVTRHVVLLSIDGLRPDAISSYEAPTLQRLIREGSYTLGASTITPSKTLPSHTSMLTGEGPERHNVLWNNVVTAKDDAVDVPTIFGVSRKYGYRTAAFFSKSKFGPLQQAGTLDYSQAPGGWWGRWSAHKTATDVEAHLASAAPNVLFVHLSDPDRAGHSSGWMTTEYGRAVTATDAAVARILAAANATYGEGQYSVIVTADHGGHGRNHGSDDPRDVTIPWIAWGRGVTPGELKHTGVRTMDTASTVVWLLGVPEPTDWAGQPVTAAFSTVNAE
jgi:arylsulfatase A-like enzyme